MNMIWNERALEMPCNKSPLGNRPLTLVQRHSGLTHLHQRAERRASGPDPTRPRPIVEMGSKLAVIKSGFQYRCFNNA